MDMPSLISIGLTLAINLASLAYMTGVIAARLDSLEKDLSKLEIDVREMRTFPEKLATVRTELNNLTSAIHEVKAILSRKLDGVVE